MGPDLPPERSDLPQTRTQRLDRWVRHSPPILIAGLVLFLLLTGTELVRFGRDANGWIEARTSWRQHEYAILNSLHSDFTVAFFESQLGSPTMQQRVGPWVVYYFQRREYWVEVLTHPNSASVGFYAVTSCSSDFQPSFRFALAGASVTLQRSRLSDTTRWADSFFLAVPADSGPDIFLSTSGSHAENYQYYAWGLAQGCDAWVLTEGDFDQAWALAWKGRPIGDLPSRFLQAGGRQYVRRVGAN